MNRTEELSYPESTDWSGPDAGKQTLKMRNENDTDARL